MFDTYKYDSQYFVHDIDSDPTSGEGFETLNDATDAAKDDAIMGSTNLIITHVLTRPLKKVTLEVIVEDV